MSPSVCMSVPVSISHSHTFFLRIRFSLAECQCSASHPQASRGAWSGGPASHPQCVWKRRVKTTERSCRPGSCSGYLPFTGEESVGLALTAQRWDIYASLPYRRTFLSIPLVVVDWEGARSGLKKSRLSPGMVEVGWGWFGGEKVVPGPLDRVPRGPLPAAWRLGGTITSGVTRRVVGYWRCPHRWHLVMVGSWGWRSGASPWLSGNFCCYLSMWGAAGVTWNFFKINWF